MKAYFIKSAVDVNDYFKDKRHQICIVGRSNVGKSSLINALGNNSKLARVSNSPGLTRLVNFFDFDKFVLIDLPGYGYAKADNKTKELIYQLILDCLNYNKKIISVIQLCNIDVITEDDLKMSRFLKQSNLQHLILLTKDDRVNKSFFNNNKAKIAKFLEVNENILLNVSSKTKNNINKAFAILNSIINNYEKRD